MKKVTIKDVLEYIKEGIIWSTLWTAFLTPYSIIVEELTLSQFLYWMFMEYTIVLPLGPIVNFLGNRIIKKLKKK